MRCGAQVTKPRLPVPLGAALFENSLGASISLRRDVVPIVWGNPNRLWQRTKLL